MNPLLRLEAYQYILPPELIAQEPAASRDSSRLMVIDRATGSITLHTFRDLPNILNAGDRLIFNDTRVIPARLIGKRDGGGAAEIFLVKERGPSSWEVLVKPGRKLREGAVVTFSDRFRCTITEVLDDGSRIAKFEGEGAFEVLLQEHGTMPLPHYIDRAARPNFDNERYQTVYAANAGAVAAPTAGLHFTPELLSTLSQKGVSQHRVTLHVGIGTFRPVAVEDITQHPMHSEVYVITPEAAAALNAPKSGRQICVGTTSMRATESAANDAGVIMPGSHETNIFIYPGYRFKLQQSLLTNFHLPGSTLLMLVSAFVGYDLIKEAYALAIKERFRFFSYGDAMLIL